MKKRLALMSLLVLPALLTLALLHYFGRDSPHEAPRHKLDVVASADETTDDGVAADEIQLADLLDLSANEFKAAPYIRVAQSLQALGKEKACAMLREFAAKDTDKRNMAPGTVVLCRMLFKARQGS